MSKLKNVRIIIDADLETGQVQITGPIDLRLPICNILATAIQIVVTRPPTRPNIAVPPPAPQVIPNGGNGN